MCEKPKTGYVERVGDKGADDAGDERVAFKIFAVEHFHAGDRRAQGGAEKLHPVPPAVPASNKIRRWATESLELIADPRAQARADNALGDLADRPPPRRRAWTMVARALTGADDGTDMAALVVEGVDHGVGARALGFGREAVRQVAAEQAAPAPAAAATATDTPRRWARRGRRSRIAPLLWG